MKQHKYNKRSGTALSTSHQEKDTYKDKTITKGASFDNFTRIENFTVKRKTQKWLKKASPVKRNSPSARSSKM